MKIRLKNIGSLPLHGKMPGEVWDVDTDNDGRPTDALWRKRLYDEEKHKVGVVAVVEGTSTADKTVPPPDIGPLVDLIGRLADLVEDVTNQLNLTKDDVKSLRDKIDAGNKNISRIGERVSEICDGNVISRIVAIENVLREAAS